MIYILFGLVIWTIVNIVNSYRNYKIAKKNEMIARRNAEISLKNKEIALKNKEIAEKLAGR